MIKTLRGAHSIIFFVSISITFASAKDFKIHDPDAVTLGLRSGNPTQRGQLATELNILAPNFSDPAAQSNAPCVSFDRVDERRLRLRADADNAVIVADSGECDSTYLIVFDKEPKSEWGHVQTVRLSSHAQHPEVSFAEVVQPGISEVMVHRETTRDSGRALQENFVVLKLLHNRLVPVLDTVERYELVMPNRPENDADHVEQSQQSTFSVVKAWTRTLANACASWKKKCSRRGKSDSRYTAPGVGILN